MSGRTEFWLWSGSILGAVALHGGLAALFAGTTALAAVPPAPLRVTISAVPSVSRVGEPVVAASLASAVPVQAMASTVPIQAATTIAPQMAAPVQAIATAAQGVTSPVAAPAAPTQVAASPTALPLAAADVAALPSGNVPVGAVAEPAAAASTITAIPEAPLAAAPVVPGQTTATTELAAVALAVPSPQAPPVAAAVAAPSLAGAPSAAMAAQVAVATQPSAGLPLASIASSGASAAAPGAVASTASAVAINAALSAGAPIVGVTNQQSPIAPVGAVAPGGSAPQVIAGEEAVVVAETPEMPVVEAAVASVVPTASALSAFLAGYDGGTCFAARVDTIGETAALSAYAVDFADSVALQLALGQSFDEPVDVSGYRAEPSQCGALAFVSRLQRLAGAPLMLTLDAGRLADGETMTGTLVGPPDTAFHLLVVDDEGMVSAANAYLDVRGGSAVFAFPVHLTGDAAAKLQLVIGLATALDMSPPAGRQPADPFFAALSQRLVEAGNSTAVAIAAFSVE